MKRQTLLLLLFLVLCEACLRVQDATPKCACKVQGLDRDSVYDYTKDTELILNVTAYDTESPTIITDDCSVSVQCSDQYSLIVLDTDSYTMFGDYSADGFCDPTTQTWLVADDEIGFSSFSQMNGLCVKYKSHCDTCQVNDIRDRDPGVKYTFLCSANCRGYCFATCSRSDDLNCRTIKHWVENENGKYQVGMTGPAGMVDFTCGGDGRWMENGQGIPKLTKYYCTFEDCV